MRKEPTRNVYVGHRYVPLILEEWDNKFEYEGLSVVTHKGASYTSKKRVPVGIDILNKEFWSLTGNYNAQVEYYRDETERVAQDLLLKSDQTYVDTELDKKADQTYVDTELGKKANQTYVDTELDKKADQTYVDHETLKLQDKINDVSVSVKDFGAVGDGVTDDTVSIQDAINYLKNKGGGTLIIPPNENSYLINNSIIMDNVKDIVVSGGKFVTQTNPYLFRVINSNNIKFTGIEYLCDNVNGNQKLVRASTVNNLVIDRCVVENGGLLQAMSDEQSVYVNIDGDYVYPNNDFTIRDCLSNNNYYGLDIIAVGGVKNITIDNNKLQKTDYDGIKLTGLRVENAIIKNNHITYAKDHGIDCYSAGNYVNIKDNFFENCPEGAITLKSQGVADSGEFYFADVYQGNVVGNKFIKCRYAVEVNTSSDVLIKDNHIERCDGSNLVMLRGDFQNIRVESNSFINNNPSNTIIDVSGRKFEEVDNAIDKIFSITNNSFVGNQTLQISITNNQDDSPHIIGNISDNQFLNNIGRNIMLRTDKCHLNITNNQSINNDDYFTIFSETTEDSFALVSGNQVFNFQSDRPFLSLGLGTITQSLNSWDIAE